MRDIIQFLFPICSGELVSVTVATCGLKRVSTCVVSKVKSTTLSLPKMIKTFISSSISA